MSDSSPSHDTNRIVLVAENQLEGLIGEWVQRAVHTALDSHIADLEMRREWLSNGEAMREFDVSRSTLARWRKSGRLPFSKQGGLLFYRRSDIDDMLAEGLNHCKGIRLCKPYSPI